MSDIDELMDAYEKHFGVMFPVRLVAPNKLAKAIQSCLESGKPYEVVADENTIF